MSGHRRSAAADDFENLPDINTRFISDDDLRRFQIALNTQEALPMVALNDWMPIHQRVKSSEPTQKRKGERKKNRRDETREGNLYLLLKWPLLLFAFAWLLGLSIFYIMTRLYIALYEHCVDWTGRRQHLRTRLRNCVTHDDWRKVANDLDRFLGNDRWRERDEYAYYDYITVNKITGQLKRLRRDVEALEDNRGERARNQATVAELCFTLEGCVKSNFCGVENPRLYSETYIGTKDLVQEFDDEVQKSLEFILRTKQISRGDKYDLFQRMDRNFGRAGLCLSGGATFAYYHFGVVKALLDNGALPDIISGTSGGALVAALVCTRTNDELRQLLVPALADKIDACEENFFVWARRWWKTGARFNTLVWAEKCSWWCRGSMTFREAYERTGRVLNVTCVPSDPHSPTALANYSSCPDCVIWSAVLASTAVPGILNPVVLMKKHPDGTLHPYSFGNKWKDGSLRTDIPLNELDVRFNVSFPIVSQVNPHISLFFFNARGSIGRPVSHRKGRGWRGGFVGSAIEQYLKLDLKKWLKVLRHLELLPRPLGQDWSEVWLQRFGGVITIWPKSASSDLLYILTDPTRQRLSRMLMEGQRATFPKLLFIKNRMKLGMLIEEGLRLEERVQVPISPTPLPTEDGRTGRGITRLKRPTHFGKFGNVTTGESLRQDMSSRDARIPADDDSATSRDSHAGHEGYTSDSGGSSTQRRNTIDLGADMRNQESFQWDGKGILNELRRQSTIFFDNSVSDSDPNDTDSSQGG